MRKVIVCKTTDKYADYENVRRYASVIDCTEVSDDDYWLLANYVGTSCDMVLLTIETPERVADFIELARERQKRDQELRQRELEKRKKQDKARLAKQKDRKVKKAIELLQKEGIKVEQ